MTPDSDVIIVGAGVIGLSVAYHLLSDEPDLSITVLEQNDTFGEGSSSQANGGVRFQFSDPNLRKLSLLSRPFFEEFEGRFGVSCGWHRHGYLFLSGSEDTLQGFEVEAGEARAEGIPVEVVPREHLLGYAPFLNVDPYLGAKFCAWDGTADPVRVMTALHRRLVDRGVDFRFGAEVSAISKAGGAWEVAWERGSSRASIVVNASGPFINAIKAPGGPLPVNPFKRHVFVMSSPYDVDPQSPLVVDMDTQLYAHRHTNGSFLVGGTDKDKFPYGSTGRPNLEDILESGQRLLKDFGHFQYRTSYTGVRSLTQDYRGIVHREDHDSYIALAGFTGHGFMHAPAVGEVVSEIVLKGNTSLVDVDAFSKERFESGQHATEKNTF